jgi:hypothetical protein
MATLPVNFKAGAPGLQLAAGIGLPPPLLLLLIAAVLLCGSEEESPQALQSVLTKAASRAMRSCRSCRRAGVSN